MNVKCGFDGILLKGSVISLDTIVTAQLLYLSEWFLCAVNRRCKGKYYSSVFLLSKLYTGLF